ncbi:MAG: hypothetical protein IRY95_00580 [Clostridia bacterium]|nr:hypothetical protein [Clostridia bacterium]
MLTTLLLVTAAVAVAVGWGTTVLGRAGVTRGQALFGLTMALLTGPFSFPIYGPRGLVVVHATGLILPLAFALMCARSGRRGVVWATTALVAALVLAMAFAIPATAWFWIGVPPAVLFGVAAGTLAQAVALPDTWGPAAAAAGVTLANVVEGAWTALAAGGRVVLGGGSAFAAALVGALVAASWVACVEVWRSRPPVRLRRRLT